MCLVLCMSDVSISSQHSSKRGRGDERRSFPSGTSEFPSMHDLLRGGKETVQVDSW